MTSPVSCIRNSKRFLLIPEIKPLSQYNVIVVDPVKETTGYMENVMNKADSYYTFICDGCDHFYIEELIFSDTHNVQQEIHKLINIPVSRTPPLISKFKECLRVKDCHRSSTTRESLNHSCSLTILFFSSSPYTNLSLPQLIPSPMATFHVHNSIVNYFVKADLQSDYLAVKNDQKRSVYSPKLWNPNAEQKFDYTFSDATKVYNFSINLESVRLLEDGDELDVQVGSVDGSTTLDKKFVDPNILLPSLVFSDTQKQHWPKFRFPESVGTCISSTPDRKTPKSSSTLKRLIQVHQSIIQHPQRQLEPLKHL